jgi:hypothetical protein
MSVTNKRCKSCFANATGEYTINECPKRVVPLCDYHAMRLEYFVTPVSQSRANELDTLALAIKANYQSLKENNDISTTI